MKLLNDLIKAIALIVTLAAFMASQAPNDRPRLHGPMTLVSHAHSLTQEAK